MPGPRAFPATFCAAGHLPTTFVLPCGGHSDHLPSSPAPPVWFVHKHFSTGIPAQGEVLPEVQPCPLVLRLH